MTKNIEPKFLTFSRTNFVLSVKVANKVTKDTGYVIQVVDDSHEGIYYAVSSGTDEYDFAYVKGFLHAIEQVMVDMFQ